MALNLNSGGDLMPYAKWNAKSGRFYAKKGDAEVELTNPTFVADLENIRTGWFFFKEAAAPQIILDPSLSHPAPKPDATYTDSNGKVRDCFKRGFELKLFSQQAFGGVVVLNGASMHLNSVINDIHSQYLAGKDANQGMLPVLQITGNIPKKDTQGTNYAPVIAIVKWIPRPAEFDAAATPQPPAAGVASNQSSPTQPVTQVASLSEF